MIERRERRSGGKKKKRKRGNRKEKKKEGKQRGNKCIWGFNILSNLVSEMILSPQFLLYLTVICVKTVNWNIYTKFPEMFRNVYMNIEEIFRLGNLNKALL